MGDSDIARLCGDIYRQHKRAIDLIIKHLPNHQQSIRLWMEDAVTENDHLILDNAPTNGLQFVSFIPESWNAILPKGTPGDFSPEARLLIFAFYNFKNDLHISLTVRPGPTDERERLFDIARKNAPLLGLKGSLSAKYVELYRCDLLTEESYGGGAPDLLIEQAQSRWEDFLTGDLPKIEIAFLQGLTEI